MSKVTILGQHIRLIRPKKIRMPTVYKKDLPPPRYNKRPKTIKEHCGRVVAVCVMLKNGGVRCLTKGTHVQVCEALVDDVANVSKVGWQLDNGNYLWR